MICTPRAVSSSRVPSHDAGPRFWVASSATVALTRVAVSLLALAGGFRAVSDDDFARVVIAQGFAASPALDPSGTSWLPFPFWWTGSVMMVFGRSLAVARATAFVTAILAALLLLIAARWLARGPVGALFGALLACLVPYGSWLGVATVPDYSTAALIVLAIASVASRDPCRRLLGAAALLAATLCRYEAWPVAAGWVLWTAWDAWCADASYDGAGEVRACSRARRVFVLAAVVGVAGPAFWVIHGVFRHGDPWFFVARVADYQAALGRGTSSIGAGVLGVPRALMQFEPELVAVTAAVGSALWLCRRHTRHSAFRRPLLLALALVLFLVVGQVRAAAPTHHEERALLSVWLLAALFVGDSLVWLWQNLDVSGRWRLAALVVPLLGLALVLRDSLVKLDPFVDRSNEVDIGLMTARVASTGDVLIDTPDYGFFAVMAAVGAPERARPVDDRDPRRPRGPNPFVSHAVLRRTLHERGGAAWLVVTRSHARVASQLGIERASNAHWVLFQLVE